MPTCLIEDCGKIKLSSEPDGEDDRFISGDGVVKKLSTHIRDEEIDEHTKDVVTVMRGEINARVGTKRERIYQKKSGANRTVVDCYTQSRLDRKKSLKESGYVRYRTPDDIRREEWKMTKDENLKKHGKAIDDHIVRLVKEYISLSPQDRKKNFKKYQPMECAILGLTKGPANMNELIKRLDYALEGQVNPETFRFGTHVRMDSIFRRVLHAKQWLVKYLEKVDDEGSAIRSRYQFPPHLMKIAAENPHKLWVGMSGVLPSGTEPFEEQNLLQQFPELSKMKGPEPSQRTNGKTNGKPSDLMHIDNEDQFKERVHFCESSRRKREGEFVRDLRNIVDITKYEFLLGLMQITPRVCSFEQWEQIAGDFINKNELKLQFKRFTRTDISSIIRNRFIDDNAPVSKLILEGEKSSSFKVYGLVPDVAEIPWLELIKMIKQEDAGWNLLNKHTQQNDFLKSYVECKTIIRQEKSPLIDEKEEKGFEITDVGEAPPDSPIESFMRDIFKSVAEKILSEDPVSVLENIWKELKQHVNISVNLNITPK